MAVLIPKFTGEYGVQVTRWMQPTYIRTGCSVTISSVLYMLAVLLNENVCYTKRKNYKVKFWTIKLAFAKEKRQ